MFYTFWKSSWWIKLAKANKPQLGLFKLPSRQTYAGASAFGGTTNQRLLLFAYGSALRFGQGSDAHCGNCCQDMWQEVVLSSQHLWFIGPNLQQMLRLWTENMMLAQHCSFLGLGYAPQQGQVREWGKVRWLLYVKMRNLYVHLSVVLEMERNTSLELWMVECWRGDKGSVQACGAPVTSDPLC